MSSQGGGCQSSHCQTLPVVTKLPLSEGSTSFYLFNSQQSATLKILPASSYSFHLSPFKRTLTHICSMERGAPAAARVVPPPQGNLGPSRASAARCGVVLHIQCLDHQFQFYSIYFPSHRVIKIISLYGHMVSLNMRGD